ncbi:HAD family hydrolase [Caproiciproducens galactitolivorans]|uniref:D-glycero-alpha-D-manno-heptose-1,7-bisphosphate 7-phosphatase n=1 Tax=Caproiciproducens galactitolivorans TaxID=642589 RepID=UPI002409A1C0|nr:HAD family hydrolase [Caproiciproducens galactitolivorans]
MEKAVFFDRDGTLIQEMNYLRRIEDIHPYEGAAEGIRLLRRLGYKIIVVSNQSGVARGYFTMETVETINRAFQEIFQSLNAPIDAVYFCPHHPKGIVSEYAIDCDCRKPKIGLAEEAQRDFDLDLTRCFMVGDKQSDIEFGQNFHARANVLVKTGHGVEQPAEIGADFVAQDIQEACRWIDKQTQRKGCY